MLNKTLITTILTNEYPLTKISTLEIKNLKINVINYNKNGIVCIENSIFVENIFTKIDKEHKINYIDLSPYD